MATLKRVVTNDPHKQMIQDNVDYALRNLQGTLGTQITQNQSSISSAQSSIGAIQGSIFQNGVLLTVAPTTSPQTFTHGLGRTPSIWVICDRTNAANLYRSSWDATTITLQCDSLSSTFKIWVA